MKYWIHSRSRMWLISFVFILIAGFCFFTHQINAQDTQAAQAAQPVLETEAVPETRTTQEAPILASGTCGENLTWELTEGGVLTISGTGKMADYETSSPPFRYINGKKTYIKTVVIENGVTSIADHAFEGCAVESVVFPESMEKVGSFAFEDDVYLKSVKFLGTSVVIGQDAFTGNNKLKTAGPLGGGYDYEFAWTQIIPSYAFSNCLSLTSVVIPEGIIAIGKYAFWDCTHLSSVTLPQTLQETGAAAFGICGITEVTIPASVKTLGPESFSSRHLTKVRFLGNMPKLQCANQIDYSSVFNNSPATVYYPCNDDTWTAEGMRNGGRKVVWAKDHHFENGVCTICGAHEDEPAPQLSVSYSTKTLDAGETFTFSVNGAQKAEIFWSVGNSRIASVDENGKVTAKSNGNTYLYAKALDGRTAKCLLKISDPAALSIGGYTEKSIKIGQPYTFTVTNDYGQKITWSVGNSTVAKVDADGVVTGLYPGNTYLYAEAADGRSVKCLLKVRGLPVAFKYTEITIVQGNTRAIQILNAGLLKATWRVGNTSVAIVWARSNNSCVVAAETPGNTWLYASVGKREEVRCLVRVVGKPPKINYTDKSIRIGESFSFSTLEANGRKITWSVGNPSVATVDANGVVTARGEGNTYLYATAEDGGRSSCLIRCSKLSIRYTEKTIWTSYPFQFTLYGNESGNVTWSVDDPSLATVDAQGVVTAKGSGTTYIRVRDSEGNEAKCKLICKVG